MTCSSSTTSTAERRPRGWRRRSAGHLAAALLALSPFAGHAEAEPNAALIAAARRAIVRGDGIDAEAKLRTALDRGVAPADVATFMGEAYLIQGDTKLARQWLAPGRFVPDTAAEGFRALAQLEQREGNLAAAGAAYDRALAITPDDASLWVEIGRLRYRGGEHLLALEAADRAMALGPRDVRALEFRGELVRDRYGLLAALPWFEAGLAQAPRDLAVLTEYAATLGELGRASEALAVTRRILEISAGDPRAFYLQAVLAARAGRYELARGLLARTRGKLDGTPGVLLLQGVLELSAGNTRTASEALERLLERQPDNMSARQLLARTLFLGRQYRYLTLRFRDDIAREEASPYVLTVVARAYEALGDRAEAGRLLDLAAMPQVATLRIVPDRTRVGALMAQGRSAEALALAEQERAAAPGGYDAQALAGDVQLALGNATAAQQRYADAARIRMSDSLLLRRFVAYAAARDVRGAKQMVQGYLAQNPGNRTALRLSAALSLNAGDPVGAADILDYLSRTNGERDVQLLSDLAVLRAGSGDAAAAERSAEAAYRLQRASPLAAQALGISYAATGTRRAAATALLEKARRMMGDNQLIAQARARLAGMPQR